MVTQLPRNERISKDQAGYVEHARSYETCATCRMYGVGNCHLVEGSINPVGYCRFWESLGKRGTAR